MLHRLRRFTLPGLLLLCILLYPNLGLAETLSGRVKWIYDGDSIEVAGVGTVRLLGIDAPEHKPSQRDRYYQRWGIAPATLRRINQAGKTYLIESVKGKTVVLKTEQKERDRYNRLLAYVYLPDGQLLNRLLLEKGHAVVYRRFDFALRTVFLEAEAQARCNKRGLWQ
ncbi:MAG: thermonuclease family protein [Syntrophotaleaceae bacterium]